MKDVVILLIAAALIFVVAVKGAVTDMAKGEARTRLGRIPTFLLRLALRRVPADLREDLASEWLAELDYVLAGTDGLPVTRLWRGVRYSAGILASARAVATGLALGNAATRSAAPFRFLGFFNGAYGLGLLVTDITAAVTHGTPAAQLAANLGIAACIISGASMLIRSYRPNWFIAVPTLLGFASYLISYLLVSASSFNLGTTCGFFVLACVLAAFELRNYRGRRQAIKFAHTEPGTTATS